MGPFHHHISLMHGWIPLTVQLVAGLLLAAAVGWRSRRWRLVWLPAAVGIGLAAVAAVHWFITSDGLSGNPAPPALWVWILLTGAAVGVLAFGWRGASWWRRGASALAVPVCLLSTALMLNIWVGYFPTVQTAWNQLTSGPLPDQTDSAGVTAVAASTQAHHILPTKGSVIPVTIPATASGFKHRGELVYLPPAWFASTPPPKLPTVMMIGGEFNTPSDWLRAGNAVATADAFAAAHNGNAPVLVFVDSGGSFNNDTECVNGPRGQAADHLTKDVVPYMTTNFGVSAARTNWGVVGWSMGGTCAVDLATMHPDLFTSIVDIAGDLTPNSGNHQQTVARLYGGNTAAWAAFDPTTVITKHGRYSGLSAWFAVNDPSVSQPRTVTVADAVTPADPTATARAYAGDQTAAAKSLCALGSAHGIDCAVIAEPGKHDWPFAGRVFATALPWLAGALGTPGIAPTPLQAPVSAVSATLAPGPLDTPVQTRTQAAGR
jgi:S-formylglutathione hydrolase FrmB